MLSRSIQLLLIVVTLAITSTALRKVFTLDSAQAQASAKRILKDNAELKRLHDQDQADRTPPVGKEIDWTIVGPRDKARLARVKELSAQNRLQTANDYYHAALILQHGEEPEDFLLSHEFCYSTLYSWLRSH